jgi:hypothetical protein
MVPSGLQKGIIPPMVRAVATRGGPCSDRKGGMVAGKCGGYWYVKLIVCGEASLSVRGNEERHMLVATEPDDVRWHQQGVRRMQMSKVPSDAPKTSTMQCFEPLNHHGADAGRKLRLTIGLGNG